MLDEIIASYLVVLGIISLQGSFKRMPLLMLIGFCKKKRSYYFVGDNKGINIFVSDNNSLIATRISLKVKGDDIFILSHAHVQNKLEHQKYIF